MFIIKKATKVVFLWVQGSLLLNSSDIFTILCLLNSLHEQPCYKSPRQQSVLRNLSKYGQAIFSVRFLHQRGLRGFLPVLHPLSQASIPVELTVLGGWNLAIISSIDLFYHAMRKTKTADNSPPLPDSNHSMARETQEDTEFMKRSKAVKRRWQNPEYRASVFAALNSPEARSKAAKSKWQNPEYRERTLAKLHSPEVKAKSSRARAKRFQEEPDIFKRGAKTMRERHVERLKQLLGGDPKIVLEDLYIRQGLSQEAIANHFHKDQKTISIWFKKYGISQTKTGKALIVRETEEDTKLRRSLFAKRQFQNPEYRESVLARLHSPEFKAKGSIARAKRFKENPDIFKRAAKTKREHKLEQLRQMLGGDPKQVLEDLHYRQGLSQNDIANRFHKTPAAVSYWFKRFGIPTNHHISATTNREQNAEQLEQLLGGDPKQVLEDLYTKQHLPVNTIAHRYYKHPDTVRRWFKKYGIVLIPDKSSKTGGAINRLARELVLSAIKNGLFAKLPQRKKDLLTLRYLETGKPLTLDEIAKKMGGISRQRINELEKTSLHYLQTNTTPDEAMRRHIQNLRNPEYRKRVLARLHSPEAIERSRVTRLQLYQENPDIYKRVAKSLREHKLEQLKQLLGGDPKQVLEDLYIRQGLSQTAIANRFHKTPAAVSYWFKRFGILGSKSRLYFRRHPRMPGGKSHSR